MARFGWIKGPVFMGAVFMISGHLGAWTYASPESLLGARSLGMAGVSGATALAHDSLFQNPASATRRKIYALGLGYQGAGDALTASIVDTKSGPLNGGAFYLRRNIEKESDLNDLTYGDYLRKEQYAGFALMGRFSDVVGVGATARYVGITPVESGSFVDQNFWTGDLGLNLILSPQLVLGLVGQNLIEDDGGFLLKNFLVSLEFEVSPVLKVNAQMTSVKIPNTAPEDASLPSGEPAIGWGVSAEYVLQAKYTFRAGYNVMASWERSLYGAGLSYGDESFSLDYGLEGSVEESEAFTHNIGFTAFF